MTQPPNTSQNVPKNSAVSLRTMRCPSLFVADEAALVMPLHLASPEQIRATADQILADAGHTGRLQIQISENVPLDRWQTSFPIIAEAIEAFGTP